MTDTATPHLDSLTSAERRAIIEELQAEAMTRKLRAETGLMDTDTRKRLQDIWIAPLALVATSVASTAALIGATAALIHWLEH